MKSFSNSLTTLVIAVSTFGQLSAGTKAEVSCTILPLFRKVMAKS